MTTATDMVTWLRHLHLKGGKGVVDNVDARALGRIADEIERLRGVLKSARHYVDCGTVRGHPQSCAAASDLLAQIDQLL